MEFFEVTAKCGHIGKGQYYKGRFFVRADSGSMAAALVRQKPRVKHDHKDAIQSVVKIDYAEFKAGQATYCANPYFSCRNIQEQRLCLDVIAEDIRPETRHEQEVYGQDDRQAKLKALRKLSRKMDKYGYNNYNNYYIGA